MPDRACRRCARVHTLSWNYGDAMYHSLVTATTVGYGDQQIRTQGR